FFDRSRVHSTPTPHDHPIRLVAAYVEPQTRLVLHFRRWNRILLQFEAVILGELLKQRKRLAAITTIEEDIADCLALEFFEAAFLLADILDDHRQTIPVR